MIADDQWELFQVFAEPLSAALLVEQFRTEGVPARVESRSLECGMLTRHCVLVRHRFAHRARWVTAQSSVTDAELEFLATGQLPDAGEKRVAS
jgi:hypothetical protein